MVVFILANSADHDKMPVSSESSLFAEVPAYLYPEGKGLIPKSCTNNLKCQHNSTLCACKKPWKTCFFVLANLTSLYIHVHYLHNSVLQETLVFHQPKSFPASACTLSIDLQLIHNLQVTLNIYQSV